MVSLGKYQETLGKYIIPALKSKELQQGHPTRIQFKAT